MPQNETPTIIEDSCSAPKWLDTEYFQTLLRKVRNDSNIKVQSVHVKNALPKGENYASMIYRVRVVFLTENEQTCYRSFIVKGLPTAHLAQQKLGEYNVHQKEMDVYQHVLPELKRLMRSIGDRSELYPNALAIEAEKDAMVFKDLLPRGYLMVDRTIGMDDLHLKMSLKTMAKLHASSLKLAELYPTIFDRYKTGMMTRETDAFYPFFYGNLDALTEEISTWDVEWQYYAKKICNLREHFVERGLTVFDHEDDDDLRVFVHGDFWTNNLLFKYDSSGKPIDVVLIDFQFSCYGTPVIDLCYFFYSSTVDDIRQNCFDEYMQYYYCHLADYTKRLHCRRKFPTLHQFQQQVLKKQFFAVYTSFIALPVQINEDTVDADFEALMGNDERSQRYRRTIMSNGKYQKIMKGLLPTFDRKGLLDKLD